MGKDVSELLAKKVCPRCGQPYKWIEKRKVGNNAYYYAVHEYRLPGGKRKIKKCYLGPEQYIYVTKMHTREGLELKGLVDPERALEYLDAIIQFLQSVSLEPWIARSLAERFRKLADVLEGIARGESNDRKQ